MSSFNTQPPEGGWERDSLGMYAFIEFQHTAARRRLGEAIRDLTPILSVSTHSRPKAAGFSNRYAAATSSVSTHSRPKAAGVCNSRRLSFYAVSTHSRPKAAGTFSRFQAFFVAFQHTAARRRLDYQNRLQSWAAGFQHTAARRRLAILKPRVDKHGNVSTHSRPKAAGRTQRPAHNQSSFQHTAARRRLGQH